MQPYVFPFMGYFQLIKAVDLFIFYNDVNFIKKGWINRNRILLNESDYLFTIPCLQVSQNKRICETRIGFDQKEKDKFLATVTQAYRKAPFFSDVFMLVEKIVRKEYEFIDDLAMESVREVCGYLNIATRFEESDGRYDNQDLKREHRLIDICLSEKAVDYINPIGGQEIYEKPYFQERGVNLHFLKFNLDRYKQFENEFIPALSIIDVLMFNDRDAVVGYLGNFELI